MELTGSSASKHDKHDHASPIMDTIRLLKILLTFQTREYAYVNQTFIWQLTASSYPSNNTENDLNLSKKTSKNTKSRPACIFLSGAVSLDSGNYLLLTKITTFFNLFSAHRRHFKSLVLDRNNSKLTKLFQF